MKLSTLIQSLDRKPAHGTQSPVDIEVTAICYDSRKVVPGAVFVAMEGEVTDGHRFAEEAVRKGAVAVVCKRPVSVDAQVIRVLNPRTALANMACRFFGHPAKRMTMVGVTGTNGKTTVTYLMEEILKKAGYLPGVVGTINYRYADKVVDNPVTTPESVDLQGILKEMADGGVTHVVMEVSSHSLDQSRVDGVDFDLALFTNFTQDHLDYHKEMDRYWACKKRLFFEHLKPMTPDYPLRVVVNVDDPKGAELADAFGPLLLTASRLGKADVYPIVKKLDRSGIFGRIVTPQGEIPLASKLVGAFNLENILIAAAGALALKVSPVHIQAGISSAASVPGRLESIVADDRPMVFVDYAHTPDALENVLSTLKELAAGRLITVFGCGGDRDKKKRPLMGEIAARISDLAVITSDNPRSEDPAAIIEQVEVGVRRVFSTRFRADALQNGWKGKGYLSEPDRMVAIETAIGAASAKDIVLIAGKGHETYQILGNKTIHFDDREAVRKVFFDEASTKRGAS